MMRYIAVQYPYQFEAAGPPRMPLTMQGRMGVTLRQQNRLTIPNARVVAADSITQGC
jgi:hypothetical protein